MAACAWSSEKMNRIFGRSAACRDRIGRMQANAAVTDKHRTRRIMDHPKVMKRLQQQQDYSPQVHGRFKQTCVGKKSFLNLPSLPLAQPTMLNRIRFENKMHFSCGQFAQQKLRVNSDCAGRGFERSISSEGLDIFFLQTMNSDPVRYFASVSPRTF